MGREVNLVDLIAANMISPDGWKAYIIGNMDDGTLASVPGWLVQLTGHEVDLSYWERSLKPPFDPWCERIPRDGHEIWALRSHVFDGVQNASEVRARAIPLIQRLNGALAMDSEPLSFQAVMRIHDKGGWDLEYFIEGTANVRIRSAMATAIGEVRDTQGNLIPPSPPKPSTAQMWIEAAEKDGAIADMLVFAGRADNWPDIYKALELAKLLVGGKDNLLKLLGDLSEECKNMGETANSHRHARPNRPPPFPTSLTEAKPLLGYIVRTVLTYRLASTCG